MVEGTQALIGRTIGSFRIEQKLGEGGMGAVYRAIDVNLDRPVALKVIRPELAQDPTFATRFKREAKAAARFAHPNSVTIFAYGEDQGFLYMALELLRGRELFHRIRERGRLEVQEAVAITAQLLAALQKAHELGIVHRDLKPQNIILEPDEERGERVKILDFGIAKLREESGGADLTQEGVIMGTLAYMAPEQAKGERIDSRADLYSAGIILYEMLTGALPFTGRTATELLRQQISSPPPSPRAKRPDVPASLEAALLRALEKDPAARFATAREMAQALDPARTSSSSRITTPAEAAATLVPESTCSRATGGLAPPAPGERDPGTTIHSKDVLTIPPPGAPVTVGSAPTDAPDAQTLARVEGGPAPADALLGATIDGKYEVLSLLGGGGMGSVYKARHKLLDKLVALKLVHPALAGRADVRERFFREAKAATGFVHPNAVPVREFGQTQDGRLYMTQDLSPGRSLREVLQESQRLEVKRALRLVRHCLLALGEAHEHGIVHRDVKPENILVEKDERTGAETARVCDFGISKLAEAAPTGGATGPGLVVGTPHYMAPEQGDERGADPRADIYSIGCVLYELLTGQKVFAGGGRWTALTRHATEAPVPPSKHVPLPAGLDAVILRTLEKEPERRPASARELVALIDALGILEPRTLTPRRVAALAVAGVLLGVALIFVFAPPGVARTRALYAEATRAEGAARLELLKRIPPVRRARFLEVPRLEAITLAQSGDPRAAVDALRAYAQGAPVDDALTARLVAASLQRWALLEREAADRELAAIAAVGSTVVPTLAACALHVRPLGPATASASDRAAWLAACREALSPQGDLERAASIPEGYEGLDARPVGWGAGWIASLLAALLELEAADPAALRAVEKAAAAFPCPGTRGLHAVALAAHARDAAEARVARAQLAALGFESRREGALALVLVSLREAVASGAGRDALLALGRDAAAVAQKPLAGLDVDAAELARRVRLEAAIALASVPEARAEATAALDAALAEAPADPRARDLLARAHVSLGLALAGDPARRADALRHLAFAFADEDPERGYGPAGGPLAGAALLEIGPPAVDETRDLEQARGLLARLQAVERLERRPAPRLRLVEGRFFRRAAALHPEGRAASLETARTRYEDALASEPAVASGAWEAALAGRIETSVEIARARADVHGAVESLDEADRFLEASARELARRGVPAPDVSRAVSAAQALLVAERFAAVGAWLARRDAARRLEGPERALLEVLVARTALDARGRGALAHAHAVLGHDLCVRGKTDAGLPHLVQAAAWLETPSTPCSEAAIEAAGIAFTRPKDVDRARAPWGLSEAKARGWGRDLLARRLGADSFDALATAARGGKLAAPEGDAAAVAAFLVEDILGFTNDTEACLVATRIHPRYPKAHLALARKRQMQRERAEARSLSKQAFDLCDEKSPDIAAEAAHIYLSSCEDSEVASAEYLAVVERALGFSKAAAAVWRENYSMKLHAFAPFYWRGRHLQLKGDLRAALGTYEQFMTECEAGQCRFHSGDEKDVRERAQECRRGTR